MGEESDEDELPKGTAERAEELTRRARAAADDAERAAYREERAAVLAEHGFTARVREEADGDVLVCHPDEWVLEGTIRPDRIEDTDRAIEVPLSGPGDPDDWTALAAHNDRIVERVADEHGETHAANARAFADFASNHYARPIESVTDAAVEEFLAEYYPRNAWPTAEAEAVVEESVALTREVAASTDDGESDPADGTDGGDDADSADGGDGAGGGDSGDDRRSDGE